MAGEYTEALVTGGKLTVTQDGWTIEYYFSGSDLRYNGTFFTIQGTKIDQYINAWEKNFEKYLELKRTIPAGGSFSINGEMGMSIRIGTFEGVCLQSYHMPISTKEKLDKVISDYSNAKERASKIQKMLSQI